MEDHAGRRGEKLGSETAWEKGNRDTAREGKERSMLSVEALYTLRKV